MSRKSPVDANGVDSSLLATSNPWSRNSQSVDTVRSPSGYGHPVSSYPPSTFRWWLRQYCCPNECHGWSSLDAVEVFADSCLCNHMSAAMTWWHCNTCQDCVQQPDCFVPADAFAVHLCCVSGHITSCWQETVICSRRSLLHCFKLRLTLLIATFDRDFCRYFPDHV